MGVKLRVYLDTSIINFLFADDAPEKMEITKDFFHTHVRLGIVDVYISGVVMDEISQTKDNIRRKRLLNVIREYHLPLLPVEREEEIELLAHDYIRKGVIPRRRLNDALHVAMSTVFEMDVLISWNFRHLANIEKERRILVVNQMNGYYYPLRLATPLEVMNDENKS